MTEIYKRFSFMDGGEYNDLATEETLAVWDVYGALKSLRRWRKK